MRHLTGRAKIELMGGLKVSDHGQTLKTLNFIERQQNRAERRLKETVELFAVVAMIKKLVEG